MAGHTVGSVRGSVYAEWEVGSRPAAAPQSPVAVHVLYRAPRPPPRGRGLEAEAEPEPDQTSAARVTAHRTRTTHGTVDTAQQGSGIKVVYHVTSVNIGPG